jgi:phage tail protein X
MAKTIRTFRTCDGDVLDTICHAVYGSVTGMVEAVYEANPGLAAHEQPFAAFITITLPDVDSPRSEPVQLWT